MKETERHTWETKGRKKKEKGLAPFPIGPTRGSLKSSRCKKTVTLNMSGVCMCVNSKVIELRQGEGGEKGSGKIGSI